MLLRPRGFHFENTSCPSLLLQFVRNDDRIFRLAVEKNSRSSSIEAEYDKLKEKGEEGKLCGTMRSRKDFTRADAWTDRHEGSQWRYSS